MHRRTILSSLLVLSLLSACNDNGDFIPVLRPPPPDLLASTNEMVFSGKQFDSAPRAQQVQFAYSDDVVFRLDFPARFRNPNVSAGEVFLAEMDPTERFMDIRVLNFALEGGTYTDELVITPQLKNNLPGDSVTISLTLVQEPTEPITSTPELLNVDVPQAGPPVRTTITLTTGNTVRWKVIPYSFDADGSVAAITSDPAEGTGGQDIDIVITPTASLLAEPADADGIRYAEIYFEDQDAAANLWTLGINYKIIE